MKKLLLLLVASLTMLFGGCSQFDDSRIWDAIDELEDLYDDLDGRVEDLEEACEKMNTNIEALQAIVGAQQSGDTITSIAPIKQGDEIIGYTITFSQSEPITIYHGTDGKDGADGEDGKDGADGKDGYTPTIGVAQDEDGAYYWTLDGEWLLDAEGNKIKAVGEDGKDGEDGEDGTNGNDGITPQLEIRDGYWYISYDNGATWKELGKATGEDGKDGADGEDGKDGEDGTNGTDGQDGKDGDSLFQSVTWDEEYAYFTLSDGTVIKIPLASDSEAEEGDLPPANEIWYTSTDGEVVTPYNAAAFGVNIISNTYENGVGIITFDGDVTTIGDEAFSERSSLASVTIPDSVTSIGNYAFYYCSSLASVTIPESVTEIGQGAFSCCSSLTSITIPDGVTSIGEGAFIGCSSLAEFRGKFASEDGRCLIIDGVLHSFAPAELTEYTIPDSVTSIGKGAFAVCSSLASVTIPDSVTWIGDYAFQYCSSLASVTIPDSVTSIGDYAFEGCYSLASVYCKPTTPPSLYGDVFDNDDSERKIYVPTESVEAYKAADGWWEYADYIEGYDFENGGSGEDTPTPPANEIWYTSTDGNIVEPRVGDDGDGSDIFGANVISNTYQDDRGIIIFDTDLEVIRMGAFMLAENLQSLTIPDNVSIEGNPAIACYNLVEFCGVYASKDGRGLVVDGEMKSFAPSGLTEYTIPEEVTTIGFYSFGYCESLEKVIIPETVSAISNLAFPDSPNIKEVYCKSTTPPTGGGDMFYNHASDRKIYVPTESVEAYKTAEYWSDYADAIEPYVFE